MQSGLFPCWWPGRSVSSPCGVQKDTVYLELDWQMLTTFMVMEKYWNKCCADYHPCLAIIHFKWVIGNALHISVATKKSVQGYFDLLCFTVWDLIDFSVWFPLESVYDLLPKELQLPSSREQNAAAMSQKSGGEAGPPPSMALAAGKLWFRILNYLFSQMLKTGAKACIVMHIHLPTFFCGWLIWFKKHGLYMTGGLRGGCGDIRGKSFQRWSKLLIKDNRQLTFLFLE